MKIIDWLAFRTTKRYNVIKVRSLEPNYWDKDTIMLHAVMQLVVDFVEIECSFMELDAPYTWREWLNLKLPWALRNEESFRNRERGVKHLTMLEEFYTKNDTNAPQAIKQVYLWWKDTRPNRLEPDDASGFTEYCNNTPGRKTNDKTFDKLLRKSMKIEEQYRKEDSEMLKKIIDMRDFLWT